MKHKVGDIVTIKSKEWYDKNKDGYGDIKCGKEGFVEWMSEYCGWSSEIIGYKDQCYILSVDKGEWLWTDEMFEE